MITVTDLVFDYPGHRALCGISVAIDTHSITALVGPNGAGKTTLMRCLAGLETPFSGSIMLDGIDVVAEPRSARACLGFLPDLFGLYDELSARRCLAYAAAARGVPSREIAARIDWAAGLLGLTARLDRRVGALSRGQRQRLAIGQSIIHRPKLLILDEPAAGLDPEARAELAALLRLLRQDGMTLIVSSHVLTELEDYSTHLLLLDRGRLLQSGPIGQRESPGRRLLVRLAGPAPQALPLLRGWPGVTAVTEVDAGLAFEFTGAGPAQAALLAALVKAGIPVTSFAEEQTSLQDLYLDRIRSARERSA